MIEPLIGFLLRRAEQAWTTTPSPAEWRDVCLLLLALAAVALPFGWLTGYLRFQIAPLSPGTVVGLLILSFLSPALSEEIVFRVLPIPRAFGPGQQVLWGVLSLLAFVIYHPARAWLRPNSRHQTFADGRFLVLVTLVGFSCTAAYLLSQSLWPPVLIHWLSVGFWLVLLGGCDRMHLQRESTRPKN